MNKYEIWVNSNCSYYGVVEAPDGDTALEILVNEIAAGKKPYKFTIVDEETTVLNYEQ